MGKKRFSSYVSTISDEEFERIMSGVSVSDDVLLYSVTTQQVWYGVWRIKATFRVGQKELVLTARTNNEDLILASSGKDYRDFGYAQGEADSLLVESVVSANEEMFITE